MSVADFGSETDRLRNELLRHCYQMLGSVHDAEELVQETMLRAWRARDQYDYQRASLRTWLYRIATNVCLTALRNRKRRPLPAGYGPEWLDPEHDLVRATEVPWIQPFPEAKLDGSLRLAVVAAMQFLPARQRAVLILRDVLEFSAAETGEILDMTPTAVNSGLQRARARLKEVAVDEEGINEPSEARRRELVDRYVEAFENADITALKCVLTDDAILEMPPVINWFVGREVYAGFIARVFAWFPGVRWRMLPVNANGQPAIAAYRHEEQNNYTLHSLQVLSVTSSGISRNTTFHDDAALFATFGLPLKLTLPDDQEAFSDRTGVLP